MMGGDSGTQEDMFSKLESMRAIITEVNSQFKDPVRPSDEMLVSDSDLMAGENNIRLCLYLRIFVALRNRTSCTRTHVV